MENTTHSIRTLLKESTQKLEIISDSAYLDAELLLAHSLGKNRTYLHTWPETLLDTTQLNTFNKLIEKRLTDYPVAYLLGTKAFWTLDLIVTPDVLIPRPETELLVEIALERIESIANPKILDLGTGSGAIALALASERLDSIITAVDYSERALAVARNNAKELNLNEQLTFIQSDWFDAITEKNFDLIVSNPPYIDPTDSHMKGSIRYEPEQALVAGNKGMSDIEKIIQKSRLCLTVGGWLILEHGFDQADKTAALLTKHDYLEIYKNKDLNNQPRLTSGKRS